MVLAAVFVAALALLAGYPQVSRWLAEAGDTVAAEPPPPTDDGDGPADPPATADATASADAYEESAPVDYIGTVRLSQSLIGDPTAVSVAGAFDAYFTAVNNRDHPTLFALYDPAGVVNPNNATQANALANAISTTRDHHAQLHAVYVAASPPGAVTARVTFTSEQAPGYGPRGREQETCTNWDLTYTLTAGGPRAYRILRSTATSSAC
ncbi:hypothetical protein [Virgisporangium aurantiacum]|uniref:SnoaL-like domain-containing protein n=1 Tax=Virgisporangium aurantiacum TaxID=175570 RepID=A0A8J4E6H1_9ACTN|nr:hypothetical protein [Virgisporangium aurantiacum]GIJ64075.1 hypothetical protein Vau01_115910 [Virgisporangium aurantiacum]